MSHRHLVGFEQDISHEPVANVHVLHLGRLIEVMVLGFLVIGRNDLERIGCLHGILEDSLAFFHREGNAIGVGVIPVRYGLACAFQEVRAAYAELSQERCACAKKRLGKLA